MFVGVNQKYVQKFWRNIRCTKEVQVGSYYEQNDATGHRISKSIGFIKKAQRIEQFMRIFIW